MATYNYDQLRKVLKKANFIMIRSNKHETWQKNLDSGEILQTRLSHKGKRDIPKGTFAEIIRQIGLDEKEFRKLLY